MISACLLYSNQLSPSDMVSVPVNSLLVRSLGHRLIPSSSFVLNLSLPFQPSASSSHRSFTTSTNRYARFRGTPGPSQLKEIGLVLPQSHVPYESGQLFIHRLFAYKGIILCSFNCKLHERRENATELACSEEVQYQVLIHRGDWAHMGFPVDVTAYLAESNSIAVRGEKMMTTMNGLDCVSHADIIPFVGTERSPIDHDLFERLFLPIEQTSRDSLPTVRYGIRSEIRSFYMQSSRSWMAPIHVNRETTNGVEVTVTTFYLGPNIVSGSHKHMWRYVIRLHNLTNNCVTLRERQLKVFSLNNMHQLNGTGVVGRQPELTPSRPAFQYSSTVELSQSKGGHMWGSFKMERHNGILFDVAIPMFTLDASDAPPTPTPSPPIHPSSPPPPHPTIDNSSH